ncbi:hypothetical protein I315_05975 [Cryptococcus gattii Ru294]|nr:hypothetical protein I315_05975 [Cryptococcus gattii Ru294]
MTSTDLPKPPDPLAPPIRLIVALASLCAVVHPSHPINPEAREWYKENSTSWLQSVCKLLSFDIAKLPPSIEPESVKASASDQRGEWSEQEVIRISGVLVEASIAGEGDENGNGKKDEALKYSPIARAFTYHTLELLGLPAKELVPQAEKNLSHTLFRALLAASEKDQQEKMESTRAAHSQGWGGALGRHLATGAGVVAGGVLLGVTGGLAAPAIAAVLAPLGIGTVLSASAAPVVLGTLFGVGGGGLAGRRVRERWRGVEEFSFIEVGDGHKPTQEEIDDLKVSHKNVNQKAAEKERKEQVTEKPGIEGEKEEEGDGTISKEQAAKNVEAGRLDLEQKLLNLTSQSGVDTNAPSSTDSRPASLENANEEKELAEAKRPPSLTATIVAPGLLTVSRTEAITAWRAICSSKTNSQVTLAPRVVARRKGTDPEAEAAEHKDDPMRPLGLKDGRDVYLLRFESVTMLQTGRDVDFWVESQLKGLVKKEIIKRTLLNAYFAAVSLPLSVYSMATMTLDNTWMHAQDRAKKAGRLLGEVIEKRVQGERPVVLIGSSVGALTIQHALLYLSSLPPPSNSKLSVPAYVESAYLISLPAAPSIEEWDKCRSVVSRRLVNAWSDADLVLAGVVRLHEVVSRAAVMSNGIRVAGLGPVEHLGVENVDVSSVLKGHMELQAKMPEILKIIDVDG